MTRLTVERLGHLGDGIAPGPVFVPRALPGEVVEGPVEGDRMGAPVIVSSAPDRVTAPCPHYEACGGCQLQHASDRFVARWKARTVQRAMAAQGLPAPIRKVSVSPENSRRRAVFSARKTKKGALIGFHDRGSDTITEVPGCGVLMPQILALREVLGEVVALGATRKGEMRLSVTWSEAGADLSVSGGRPLDGALRIALAALPLARIAWDGEVVATHRPAVQSLDGIPVVPPPGAFLQATQHGERALRRGVAEALDGARRIADLFAGVGTFALPLARQAEVHAVEGDSAMIAALDAGWRNAQGLKRVTAEARDLFRRPLDAVELARFDGVVIDPPRAGAEAQAHPLAAAGPGVIASVSCNPVTFARDARILADGGYRLDWIDVVDQFRWSPHVELVARLSRDHIAADR